MVRRVYVRYAKFRVFLAQTCFKVFSPKFRSIPLAPPLLIFSLLGLLAFFVKKFGDLVFTWKNNSTPGIVKSRACASLF